MNIEKQNAGVYPDEPAHSCETCLQVRIVKCAIRSPPLCSHFCSQHLRARAQNPSLAGAGTDRENFPAPSRLLIGAASARPSKACAARPQSPPAPSLPASPCLTVSRANGWSSDPSPFRMIPRPSNWTRSQAKRRSRPALPDSKVDALIWKKIESETATLDFTALMGEHPKSFAYAHTYIFSEAGGQFDLQLTHRFHARIILNGKQIHVGHNTDGARLIVTFQKGWNSLLLKVSSENAQWYAIPLFQAHLPAEYEETNIAWKTPLPGARIYQGTPAAPGGPIVVGDKIFLQCEPHDLFCLNKADGKVLWVRSNSYFDALTDAEKDANPDFKEIEPLAAKWNEMNAEFIGVGTLKTKFPEREELEKKLYAALKKIDRVRFNRPESQDVGYAGFTPVSDGQFVYVWFAHGVTACYDLNGNKKWMRIDNHETVEHGYSSSPVLSGGKFVVFMRELMAFDAATGADAWRVPIVGPKGMNPGGFFHGSLARSKIGGADVVITANSQVFRASDGKALFDDKKLATKQSVATPVIDNGVITMMSTWKDSLYLLRLPDSASETADVTLMKELPIPTEHFPYYYLSWHIASPIVHEGLTYLMNNSGVLTVVDQNEGTIVYQKLLDVDHFQAPNEGAARGIGVSPMMAGKYLYFFGNCGAAVVLEPGRQFKQIAKNKIEGLAMPGSWGERHDRMVACPFADGNRIYCRTESGLYAIGAK